MSADNVEKSAFRGGKALVFLVLLIGLLTTIFFFALGVTVPPNYIGVRQNNFAIPGVLRAGYESDGLLPGRHWALPGISRVTLVPRDFLLIDINSDDLGGDLRLPELEVPTTDGARVKMDLTLVVRLFDEPGKTASGEHGGPINLIGNYSESQSQQLIRFSQVAQGELLKSLRKLSTVDYYNPEKRDPLSNEAQIAINKQVNPVGVDLWATLIRRFGYKDFKIDEQIFLKTLQGQEELLRNAEARLAEAKAATEKESALWDANIRDLEVSGETTVQVRRSEGDLAQARKHAEADYSIAEARAQVDGERSKALHDVAGADIFIAREMTPILRTLTGGVVTDLDPFNVDDWAKKFSATPTSSGGASSTGAANAASGSSADRQNGDK